MQVTKRDFERYLLSASFAKHGDPIERVYAASIADKFPNCEEFWKQFVVPLTNRLSGYPKSINADTEFRDSVDERVEDIANVHYSMFHNLVFAHRHIYENEISSLENVYTHLGATCDLAESVLVKWFILLKTCRDEKVDLLQRLTKCRFKRIAGNWYDNNYPQLYEFYAEKGKPPPVYLPARKDILVEYLGKSCIERKSYFRTSLPIREFRNVIVHDLKIARIIDRDGQFLVPKSSKIQKYRTWRSVAAASKDVKKVSEDFISSRVLCEQEFSSLASSLNSLWIHLLRDFHEEFYSDERDAIRKMFDIQFVDGPLVVFDGQKYMSEPPHAPPPSGVYTGGTSDYG